jgi:VanZ family protein
MAPFRILLFFLLVLSFVVVLFFSLRSDPTPLRKEITEPLPEAVGKWLQRSFPVARHFPAYLILTVIAQSALGGTPRRTAAVMLGLFALATILEIAQIWLPHREADIRDFLWGAMGILLGSLPSMLKSARR